MNKLAKAIAEYPDGSTEGFDSLPAAEKNAYLDLMKIFPSGSVRQLALLEALHESATLVVIGQAGSSKSYTIARILLHRFSYADEHKKSFYITNNRSQAFSVYENMLKIHSKQMGKDDD